MTVDRLRVVTERWVRILVRLYPADFRDDMGEAMVEAYCDRARAAFNRGGIPRLVAIWIRALVDSLRNGLAERIRPAAGWRRHGNLLSDVRYAGRQLKRAPGFTAVAVVAMALGIGATLTVFKVVNAVFLKPLPFERADELYRLARVSRGGTAQWLTAPEFNRWQSENRTSGSLAGFTAMDFNLRGREPEELLVAWASQEVLDVLGITRQLTSDLTRCSGVVHICSTHIMREVNRNNGTEHQWKGTSAG